MGVVDPYNVSLTVLDDQGLLSVVKSVPYAVTGGNNSPVADAGPNQLGIPAGTVTLNGCGSYDPLGLALTYQWQQISGTSVNLSSSTVCNPTFTAAASQSYGFRLTVRNTDGLQASANTTVSTATPAAVRIVQFSAIPATVQPGQSSTLSWVIDNATSATITPGIGNVDPVVFTVGPIASFEMVFVVSNPGDGLGIDNLAIAGEGCLTPAHASTWGAVKNIYR